MKIHYWDGELMATFTSKRGLEFDIIIKNGRVTFEQEGEYYGPTCYWCEMLTYDLCCLIALEAEVRKEST